MKKIISLVAAALVATTGAFALTWNPQPSSEQHLMGITVGWMDKTMKNNGTTNSLTAITNDQKLGNTLQVGVSFTPEFTYGIGLQAGVYYEWTMNSFDAELVGVRTESRTNNHEISIPLRLQWRYEIVNGLSLFAFTGPSFDFGLLYSERAKDYIGGELATTYFHNAYTGTVKTKDVINNKTIQDTKSRNDKDYKAFHPYWGVGVGFQWEYLRVQLTSDWGIMDVNARTDALAPKSVIFNKPIAVSVSYLF